MSVLVPGWAPVDGPLSLSDVVYSRVPARQLHLALVRDGRRTELRPPSGMLSTCFVCLNPNILREGGGRGGRGIAGLSEHVHVHSSPSYRARVCAAEKCGHK